MKNKISPLETLCFLLIFAVSLGGLYFAYTDQPFYEGVYVREDGAVEWATVVALILGSALSVKRAYELRKRETKLFVFCLLGAAFIFFFGAGEEISWGQRIFGIKSPEFFVKNNGQMETNFHNLVFQGVSINKLIFGTFLGIIVVSYFLIMPFLYRRLKQVRGFIDKLAIPVPELYHIAAYIILAAIAFSIPSPKKGEILEFGGCWIFFLMFARPYNRHIFKA